MRMNSLAATFLTLSLFIGARESLAEDITFIVNAENPVTSISAADLTNLFLKKRREWPDGSSVRFIDRKEGTAERNRFLQHYLGKSGRDVELFWIGQKLYTGDAAPMQVGSDESARALVASFKGAIGYVSSDFPLSKGVKKVTIQGKD